MNEVVHHTSEYEVDELVVRRGDPFTLTVNITGKTFDKNHDLIKLIFSTGAPEIVTSRVFVLMITFCECFHREPAVGKQRNDGSC